MALKSPRFRPPPGRHFGALAALILLVGGATPGSRAAEPTEAPAGVRLLPPEPGPGGWRIAWISAPGGVYELQRWDGLEVDPSQRPVWQPAGRIQATDSVAFVDEPAALTGRRFYRIARIDSGPAPDVSPPLLSAFRAELLGVTATSRVRLSVSASDVSGVREVRFLANDSPLGAAQFLAGLWSLEVPLDRINAATHLTVRASDNAGNVASARIDPPRISDTNRRFVALDASGRPVPNNPVALAPGPLPPLRYLPGGAVGPRGSLVVDLPQGAQLITDDDRDVLRFNQAEIRLGRGTALQFDTRSLAPAAPALHAPPTGRTLTPIDGGIRVTSANVLELPIGELTASDLESLLGLAPGEGVPLRVFEQFDLRWHSGVLDDTGIRGGRFAFAGLPVPALSGDYPDHVLPFGEIDEIRLPFHGRYTWPGGGAESPQLQVGPADPGWLTLRPDGSMGWHNRSEIRFPGGGRLRVDIGLDDPLYRFGVFADSVQVPLIGNLADLILPDNPAACLDPGLDAAALTRATGCLEALGLAYFNVSASAVAAAPIPENPDVGGLPLPPDDLDTSVSVLNAWGHRAVAAVGAALPMAPQRELFAHTGQSAAAATDLASAARHRAALARATVALHKGGLSGSADDTAALEAALEEATAAALHRTRSASGVASYSALLETLEALVETQTLLAEADRPPDQNLHAAVGERLQEFLSARLESLEILPSQFSAATDSPVARMNRFTLFQHLHELLDALAQAAVLEIEEIIHVPSDEALTQFAQRLWVLIEAALAESEAADDIHGFLFAFEDLLDLQASRQLSIFPDRPELSGIPMPGTAGFAAIVSRLDALFVADLARPYPERTLNNERVELRRLARILREIPADVTLAAAPFERAHERVNEKLADAAQQPASIHSVGHLVALVEIGILNEQLRRRMDLPEAADWDGTQLPTLIALLAEVGTVQRAWSELNRMRVILLDESRRLAQAGDAQRRRLHLETAFPILVAARDVAVALWESERDRRNLSPLGVADLFLPGDLVIDHAAGAAMGDRHAGWITGGFRGRLGLPKFDGRLEVLNASFDQSGAFDLAVYGSAGFRGATFGISSRQPLTVSHRAPGPIRFQGESFLTLPNGMSFFARMVSDDPTYGFRFEARDLRFELVRELALLRPTLNLAEVSQSADALGQAYLDYFGSLNAGLEGLARQAGDLPEIDPATVGQPPTYRAPQINLPFSELNAWSASVLLTVEQNANRSHALTATSLRQVFQTLHDDAQLAAETLETERQFLELQLDRLAVIRRSAEAFQAADADLLLGQEPDVAALTESARTSVRAEAKLHQQHLAARPPKDLAEASRHITVLLDITASGEVFGASFDDLDEDGFPNETDNCPALWSDAPLPDADSDGLGDACDPAPQDSGVPSLGACRDAARLAGRPRDQAAALLACQVDAELRRLGLDPANGSVAVPALFESFPAEELDYRMIQMLDLRAAATTLGVNEDALAAARIRLRDRLLAQWAGELSAEPGPTPLRQYELVLRITELGSLEGAPPAGLWTEVLRENAPAVRELSDAEIERLGETIEKRRIEREKRLARRLDRAFGRNLDPTTDRIENSRRRGVVGDSLVLLQSFLGGLTPSNAAFRTRIDDFVRHQVETLREGLVDPQFLGARLGEAESMARTLADAAAWVVTTLPAGDPLVEDLRLTLNDFTVQLTPVAEARRAWWLLNRYGRVLDQTLRAHGSTMNSALRASFQDAFAATVLASDRIATAFSTLINAADVEAFKVRLPGDLRVRQVFGGIGYDRASEVWTGDFGGRLEFPEFDKAFFEISRATIATDGSFQISAATGGPLPFGRLRLTTSLQVAGAIGGLQSISGTGLLAVPFNTATNLYGVSVGYDFSEHRFRFDTQADGIEWRLDDDFVLFDGGFGLEFSTAEPDGALTFRGSAGLFARQTPLPTSLQRTNFHLLVTNAAIRLAATTNSLGVALTNGTLILPEFFRTSLCATNRILTNFLASPQGSTSQLQAVSLATPPGLPGQVGAAISLSPTNPVAVTFQFEPASTTFSGELRFRDLGYRVPGFEALEFAVCQARLVFPAQQVPYLTNIAAALQFPLPHQTNIIEVTDGAASFALDGLPTGTVRLRTNLDLYREGDWRFSLLGTESGICPAGTGFTLKPDPAFDNRLTLRFDAGFAFAIPANVLSDAAGGALTTAACGSLSVPVDRPPFLGVDSLGLALSSARLGGSQGVALTNVSLQLRGLTNVFSPSPTHPFEARLGGTILVNGAGLGLSNAVYHFEGDPLPRFTVSELAVIQPGTLLGLATDLPLQLDEGRVRFLRDDLPVPALFAATNLVLTVSGGVALPSRDNPVLASRVRDLVITHLPNGQPQFSIDGIGFTVDLTGVLGDSLPLQLGGELYVGGLNHPPNYLFAGKLKGNIKDNAVEGLVAVDACGLRGVCLGLSGSEVNIQLAYGFVLTGARGGVSFANVSNDPCSFTDQLPIDPFTGRPTGPSPCSLPEPPDCVPAFTLQDLSPNPIPRTSPSVAGSDTVAPDRFAPTRTLHANVPPAFPCPTIGECPPASVNIHCMPHPEASDPESPHAHRVIYKFTSINEPLLNAIGITPDSIASRVPQFSVDSRRIALDLAAELRGFIDSITPRAPANAPPEIRALDTQIAGVLDQVELGFANALFCAIRELPSNSGQLASLLYSAIRDAAFAGVPCQDVTVKLEGSVSYTGVASFADVTGGLVLSTTGSAGLIGSVNVFGIPIGKARGFVNQTDAQGNPILPSMCGEIVAALGPLELGSLAYLNDCPDCAGALFSAFLNLPSRLTAAYAFSIMQVAHPDLATPGLNAAQQLALLDTPERQMAFLAAMMGTPPRDPNGQIPAAFLDFIVELADAVQPRWAMCGEIQPKLFGFPLSGGGKLYGYQFYAGPNVVDGQRRGYLLRDSYALSPIQMMANYAAAAFTVGLGGFLVPAIDEAEVSTAFVLPTFGQIAREGFTLPPPDFAARRTRDFLANATMTLSYRLAPFGMELGRAGGRILLPSLDHHPRGPSPRVPPVLRNQGLPGELDVLLAALGDKDQSNAVNRLADITWRGEGNADFASIFADSPFAGAVAGRNLSLRDDYFPHGGILGAGILDFPALLSSPVPPSLGVFLDATQPTGTRLLALQDFVSNHLLRTERVGELAFYLPAPNPPLDRFPTDPQALIESLRNFVPTDPLSVSSYYPVEEGFFSGWIDTPILGLPTVRSHALWEPQSALVRLEAEVPTNSWFNRYVNRARFSVELRGNTNQSDTVTALFTPLSNQVARLTPTSPGLGTTLASISQRLPTDLANGLPRFALALTASQVRIPVPTYIPTAPLTDALTVARINNATLEAYSPFYRRPGADGPGALDRVRRDGGFAVLGDFNFLNGAIAVSGAEFTVSPNPDPLGLPRVSSSFSGSGINVFGIALGPPPSSARSLQQAPGGSARITFLSDSTSARLDVDGSVPSLNLGSLFSLAPESGTSIGATAVFETTTSALPQGRLDLQPCRITSALLGGAVARIHGETPGDPFSLSASGGWNASVTWEVGAGVDLFFANERVLRLTRPAATGSQPFRASLSGNGLESATLTVTNLHLGVVVETFPDAPRTDPRRRTFSLASGATASLQLNSGGSIEFDATIPQTLSLAGTPLSAFQTGFGLRLENEQLTFTGNAAGGAWADLGGGPVVLTATASANGVTFRAETTLPPIDFGVFRIEEGSGRGIPATVTQSGISLPSGLTLRVNVPALGSPTLALDRFGIDSNGAFQVGGPSAASPVVDGIRFDRATYSLTRAAAGNVTCAFSSDISARTLTGFGSITPRTGSQLRAHATADTAGNVVLALDAALLRLPLVGVTVDALLHGAANTNAPFGFSTSGPWSAVATFPSLIVDPPGSAQPETLRLTPASNPAAGLFSAAVTGNQGNIIGLTATRLGSVNLQVFRDSPMAASWNNINAGTIALSVTNNPRRLSLTLDPPDFAYATNFVVNAKPVTVDLFRLSSGSLQVIFSGDPSLERSVKVAAPSLTLLPGTLLEQTLSGLPTQSLAPDAFRVFTGTPVRTLAFPGLPVVRLPSGDSGLLTLTAAGFASPIPFQEGVTYGGLLALPATSSQLSLAFSGSHVSLRFALGPTATVLGRTLALNGGEATLAVATGGGFTGTFRTTGNPDRNLGFNLLGFQPAGLLTLDGIASTIAPEFSLAGNFNLALAYPDPANPAQSLTWERQLAFDLDSGEDFSATVSTGLPSFDLGWLRVQRGSDGNVVVARNGATGAFTVSFNDWDVRLFGVDYDNQDFSLSNAGTLSRNLASSTFSLGSGISLLRLVTGGSIPFEWAASPAGTGRTFVDLPSTTALSFPSVPGLSGTLRDGLSFGSTLTDIPASGVFDRTWNRALTLNGLDFGTVSARLRRVAHNGPIEFTATRANAFWSGLNLAVSADTGNATSFAATLSGTFSVGGWNFGNANFAFSGNDPTAPFQGSATITDPSGTVGLTLGIKLRGGAKPCLEFTFGGAPRTLCLP
ncbi:MAG: hypothetical protein AB7O66_01755 [Limisphaerales bacterium]